MTYRLWSWLEVVLLTSVENIRENVNFFLESLFCPPQFQSKSGYQNGFRVYEISDWRNGDPERTMRYNAVGFRPLRSGVR